RPTCTPPSRTIRWPWNISPRAPCCPRRASCWTVMKPWIEKQRHLIDFTAQSVARRKGKSLGLLVVYTLLVFVLASVALYTHALRNETTRVLAGTPEIVLQRLIAGRHDLIPPGYIE